MFMFLADLPDLSSMIGENNIVASSGIRTQDLTELIRLVLIEGSLNLLLLS